MTVCGCGSPKQMRTRWAIRGAALRSRRRAVASAATGVAERSVPLLGHELPVVPGRMQRELEDSKGVVVGCFAIRQARVRFAVMAFTPRPHDELAEAIFGVHCAVGRLRRKALIIVLVRVYNEVCSGFME